MHDDDLPRRDFVKQAALSGAAARSRPSVCKPVPAQAPVAADVTPNMIGAYGPWAAGIVGDQPAKMSYLQPRFDNIDAWRKQARSRVMECLAQPETNR